MTAMDIAELRRRIDAGEAHEFLPFFGHHPHPRGELTRACLSQWFHAPFVCEGLTYPTAEHFMMAQKARLFGDGEFEARIMAAETPHDAKLLGRQIRGFDPDQWQAHRFDIVVTGNRAKFGATDALREFLVSTAGKVLVEASPKDRIWGIGMGMNDPRVNDPHAWEGLNLLGFALMAARDALS